MFEGFGVTSMTAPLRKVAVRPPALGSDFAAAHWAQPLNEELLLDQHAAFTGLLERLSCDVTVLPAIDHLADSCFVYDPAFVVGDGVIGLRSGKDVRVDEGRVLTDELAALGIPVLGSVTGDATADGGDMFWLDEHTLAIGRSYRTNQAAIDQIQQLLASSRARVAAFDLPHDQGPDWCLHLMSVVSPVRDDLAVVYERLAPIALLQALHARGITTISVAETDWATLGCNVLAIEPGVVVIASGNEDTAQRLADAGCEVHVYAASEITKGEGGPTCLTRPLLRSN